MLIDNKNELIEGQETTIYQYLDNNILKDGKLDFVTGYFTISALSKLFDKIKPQIHYRIVLGDLFSVKPTRRNIVDIINQKHEVNDVFNLKEDCEKAVSFLKQENVEVKTVDKNFCHAKTYIYHNPNKSKHKDNFYIVGSSNFTDAGIGIKPSANIELNKIVNGTDAGFEKADEWFEKLWDSDTTQSTIQIDKNLTQLCKNFLISLISDFFEKYEPENLYYKTLYELFKEDFDQFDIDISSKRDIAHLRDTVIFNKLYLFQQKGVMSLIRMLQKYNGAVLADAVGLGKTWSALAVMKYFELQGYKILLLCPKKLSNNWQRYLKDRHSIFEADKFDFYIRYHTDLFEYRMNKDGMTLTNFKRFQKMLIVIDESHNLRNDGSNRYKFLIDNFYQNPGNRDIKTLMLSATPINNKLTDIRNQFKLIVGGNDTGFEEVEGIEIKSLQQKFANAQKYFNKWQFRESRRISELRANIPEEIFKLIDATVVARTRQLIKKHLNEGLHFPNVEPPLNIPGDLIEIGNYKTIEMLLDSIENVHMTAYKPAFYMKEVKAKDASEDERNRQKALAKIMYILLIKRMESSWFALFETVKSIYTYHQTVYKRVLEYQKNHTDSEVEQIDVEDESLEIDEILADVDFDGIDEIGKKKPVKISDIVNLNAFKKDLKHDIEALKELFENLNLLDESIKKELESNPNHHSADSKLQRLIEVIVTARKERTERKLIIFSVFRDTAKYLYNQLRLRGFDKMALVSGTENQCTYKDIGRKGKDDFEPLLERFAPETKLYREKDWAYLYEENKLKEPENFNNWKIIIERHDKATHRILKEDVNILIATDCLSEGQNLQDADYLINYDIHWNPVRLIQRFGRIDRIGSKHNNIYGVNFWPAKNVDEYLNLKNRVESRMAAGALVGTEVQTISKQFDQILDDKDKIITKQAAKLFKQLEISWEDIEGKAGSFGFNDLSYETFRQELFDLFSNRRDELERIPNGVYTGFNAIIESKVHAFSPGLIGLLGYPKRHENDKEHRYKNLELFYASADGNFYVLNNMEVLYTLREHKESKRFVPEFIENPDEETIARLKSYIDQWMKKKFGQEENDLVNDIFDGGNLKLKQFNEEIPEERYKIENYDLITWFVVSKNKNF
ncbi:helicase-related protein [Massilibacteroides sp.]|uniref:helicase-related protein n=1 Tax=Massilibacteroides sp. TaxID=2034766 RepID=UPI0026206E9F|nr:helicase-related protein [Massilibacteroides sp.]MDD4516829.1 helicase-related protein [Massilibacteroides sp.]